MKIVVSLALALALMVPVVAGAQQFGPAELPIKADDGTILTNHRVTPELMARLEKLPGLVTVGNPNGDVTMYQFYDLNCPFCREAARDVDDLMKADRKLKFVFVPYPTLSVQSVEGSRVELAVREMVTPQRWLEFRKRIYAGRGVIDGARAVAATQAMKLDQAKMVEIANAQRVTDIMTAHAKLGTDLKMMATPSYVIGDVAVLGHPGLDPLKAMVKSVRSCKSPVC
ncbi:MAG: thioredoxin domain-containing protein [Pseudomonadota bacterium]